MGKTIDQRVEGVRDAVCEESTGLEGADYREFLEKLLSDTEGWHMELEEMGEDED